MDTSGVDNTGWAGSGMIDWTTSFDPATDMNVNSAQQYSDYLTSMEQIAPGITQRAEAAQQPGENIMASILRVIPSLALTYQQAQLLGVQTQRAKQGLPPLNMSQYGLGVSVGASPQIMTFAVIGLGLLAFMALRPGRR